MLTAIKNHFNDLSENFYANYQGILLFLYTFQYVTATGDMEVLENLVLLSVS